MYAIVEIAGQQFKVEEGKCIFVHRLDVEEGKKLDFNQVLLLEDEGKVTVGEPVIKDAFVEGKVIDHVKGDKVIVFKKKRKKGYRVKNGHRQSFTRVEILSINGKSSPKKQSTVKEASAATGVDEPAKEKKATAKKPASKPAAAEEKKKTPRKKAPEKPSVKETGSGKKSKREA
jgi:large subunit ribosomal protein L21